MDSASRALARLGDAYWEFVLRSNPTYATYLGDSRYDALLPDLGAEQRDRTRREVESFQRELHAIPVAELSEGEKVSWDILRRKFHETVEEQRHKFYQWQIDQMSGPQVSLFELINYHPLRTKGNAEDLLARFRAFPRFIDQTVENLREGLREGRTTPRIILERILGQLEAISKLDPPNSPLGQAVAKLPPEAASVGPALSAAVAEDVLPAFARLQAFLRDECLGAARDSVGIWDIAGGPEAYEFCVASHTTVDVDAQELHDIGMEELLSLQKEMRDIARARGHTGDLKSFQDSLKADPGNFLATRDDVLERFRAILKGIDAQLPRYFGRLPKTGYVVKSIEDYREKDAPAAFYYPPSEDGARPGIFYANTHEPHTKPVYNMAALAAHEAVPGHHLQIALSMERQDLPRFRRNGHFTAFVEGWALYTERLAKEMGVYPDDLAVFGMLTYQAWRACRLVVDTGLHAMRWSRQRAIDFFRDHLAIPEKEVLNEIDRYIIWPGQALGYMVGCREILALRHHARERLGGEFDLAAFHDRILENGSIPLSTLRAVVERWCGQTETRGT
jgi:uncharacterized protein (DUF885 family)